MIVACFIGTTIEWYDFFLYGTAAALVFNHLFFPKLSPLAGTLSAYVTFAVGFVARPVGGAVFGHYGDRLGRKSMLVWSEPLHVQQRKQIEAYREAWKGVGHSREPRVSVSRSIFPIVDDRDRAYFGREAHDQDQIGCIDANTRAIFGRSYAAEPDVLIKELASDEAIATADTLLLTIPNQLGVDYNAHVLESVLEYVAPELGWH